MLRELIINDVYDDNIIDANLTNTYIYKNATISTVVNANVRRELKYICSYRLLPVDLCNAMWK